MDDILHLPILMGIGDLTYLGKERLQWNSGKIITVKRNGVVVKSIVNGK